MNKNENTSSFQKNLFGSWVNSLKKRRNSIDFNAAHSIVPSKTEELARSLFWPQLKYVRGEGHAQGNFPGRGKESIGDPGPYTGSEPFHILQAILASSILEAFSIRKREGERKRKREGEGYEFKTAIVQVPTGSLLNKAILDALAPNRLLSEESINIMANTSTDTNSLSSNNLSDSESDSSKETLNINDLNNKKQSILTNLKINNPIDRSDLITQLSSYFPNKTEEIKELINNQDNIFAMILDKVKQYPMSNTLLNTFAHIPSSSINLLSDKAKKSLYQSCIEILITSYMTQKKVYVWDYQEGFGHFSHGAKDHISNTGRGFIIGKTNNGLPDLDQFKKDIETAKPDVILYGGSFFPQIPDSKGIWDIIQTAKTHDPTYKPLIVFDAAHHSYMYLPNIKNDKSFLTEIGCSDLEKDNLENIDKYCDLMVCVTDKVLGGAKGAFVMIKDPTLLLKINKMIFPGSIGGISSESMIVNLMRFREIIGKEFFGWKKKWKNNKDVKFQKAVKYFSNYRLKTAKKELNLYLKNCIRFSQTAADTFKKQGFSLVTDGTKNHMSIIKIDIIGKSPTNLQSQTVVNLLEEIGLQVTYINDSSFRFGVPPLVGIGVIQEDFIKSVTLISDTIKQIALYVKNNSKHPTIEDFTDIKEIKEIKKKVSEIANKYQILSKTKPPTIITTQDINISTINGRCII